MTRHPFSSVPRWLSMTVSLDVKIAQRYTKLYGRRSIWRFQSHKHQRMGRDTFMENQFVRKESGGVIIKLKDGQTEILKFDVDENCEVIGKTFDRPYEGQICKAVMFPVTIEYQRA